MWGVEEALTRGLLERSSAPAAIAGSLIVVSAVVEVSAVVVEAVSESAAMSVVGESLIAYFDVRR